MHNQPRHQHLRSIANCSTQQRQTTHHIHSNNASTNVQHVYGSSCQFRGRLEANLIHRFTVRMHRQFVVFLAVLLVRNIDHQDIDHLFGVQQCHHNQEHTQMGHNLAIVRDGMGQDGDLSIFQNYHHFDRINQISKYNFHLPHDEWQS